MYWRFVISACFWFSIVWLHNGRSTAAEPGYLDFDNLPDTNFSCDGKVIGGYYADTETGCQMFHVCTIGQKGEITDIKFLCLNGTVFDQETRVCERVDEVDCSKTESFFDLNLELYGNSAAGFSVAEEEEESEDLKGCDSDNNNCQTDTPHSKQPSSQHRGQGKDNADEEIYEGEREIDEISTQKTVTPPPPPPSTTTTTTNRQPIISTLPRLQSTTPTLPQVLQYPTTSPETIAALLALHNAFTASLQQHGDPQKTRPNPPRITGFLPTSSTAEFQNQNRPLARPTQFSTREQPHHFSVQKQQYHSQGTKPPGRLQSQHQTSSENYNNMNFHHSFHITNQGSHFPRESYDDEYSEIESHPFTSSIPRTEHPKPFNFENYEGEEYYSNDKLQSSTQNPYILSPLKINRLNDNQDDTKTVLNRGNFIRDLHDQNNNFETLSFRRQTTPSVSIVTSTSTTSSSSVRSGKPNQSAILTRKPQTENKHFIHPSSTGQFIVPTVKPKNNSTGHLSVESYDDYQESDVHSDPFFKDVPKISRTRRYIKDTRSNIHYRKFDILSQLLCSNNMSNIHSSVKVCNIEGYSEVLNNWIEIPKNSTIIAIKKGQPVSYNPNLPLYFLETFALSVQSIDGSDAKNSVHHSMVKPKKTSLPRNEISNFIFKIMKNSKIINNEVHKNTINNKSSKIIRKRSPLEGSGEEVKLYSSRKRQNTSQRTRDLPFTKSGRKYRVSTKTEIKMTNNQSQEIFMPQQRSSGKRRSQHRNLGRESSIAQDYLDVSRSTADVSRSRQANNRPNRRKLVPQSATVPSRSNVEIYTRTPESDSHILQLQQHTPTVQFSSTRRKHIYNDDYDAVAPSNRRKATIHSTAAPIPPLRRPSTIQGTEDSRTDTFVQKQAAQESVLEPEQQGIYREKTNVPEIPINETVTTQSKLSLKAGTQFSCEGKVKGGYYADVEAGCKGFFICTQGNVGDPLLNTHFWCGSGTKFNQRSRTCQAESSVQCSLSSRYYHLNNDFLVPELEEEFQDSFEPLKI